MTTNPSNPNPSHVQAHVMRKNAEEQSILFQDLAKWEKCMKQRDSNLRNQNEILKEENQKTEYAKTNSNVSIQREIKYDKNEYCTTSSTPPSKIRQQKTNSVKMVPQNENYQAAPSKKSSPIKVDENIQQAYHVTSNQRQVMSKEEREMQERKKGNEFYVVGKYQEAFQCYSTCLGINPKSMLAYSNRSMTNIKLKDWINAELDASCALRINPSHIKSYQRRAKARASLGKLRAAVRDVRLAQHIFSSLTLEDDNRLDEKVEMELKVEEQKFRNELMKAVKEAPKRRIMLVINRAVDKNSTTLNEDETKSTDKENTNKVDEVNESTVQVEEMNMNSRKKTSNRKRTIPKTWHEFQSIWRGCDDPTEKSDYLQKVKPHKLMKIFQNGIEDADFFVDLLGVILHLRKKKSAFHYLEGLSKIDKIKVTTMMMSKIQRKKVIQNIKQALDAEGHPSNIHEQLLQRFGLTSFEMISKENIE